MINEIKKEIEKYKKMLVIIGRFEEKKPEGYLKYEKRGDAVFYYQICKNEKTGKMEKRYIKKRERDLAKRLAQKQYYSRIKPIVEKNLQLLEQMMKKYDEEGINRQYERLPIHRKTLITPILGSKEEMIRRWEKKPSGSVVPYPEFRVYKTEQGELVRSKSEVIIANALYAHKDVLLYEYERPLEVLENGHKSIIHPDFTIINLVTGRIKYWEHAGILDAGKYADDFVKRERIYIDNDLLPGIDLVHSYETSNTPLNIGTIKQIIKKQILQTN